MLYIQLHLTILSGILGFNNLMHSDKVVTGSFDKTAKVNSKSCEYLKIWDCNTGKLCHTLVGHEYEIVCISFDPQSVMVASGSMDHTAKLWDVETGKEILSLRVEIYLLIIYKGSFRRNR